MFRRLRDPAETVGIVIDGQPHRAALGDTVAAALLAAGVVTFRRSPRLDAPRAPYCGMGVCFDCLVTIDGQFNRQACLTPVSNGMVIETGAGRPALVAGVST